MKNTLKNEKDIKPSALEYLRQNEGLIKNEIVLRLKTMFDADEIKKLDLNKTVINVFDGFEKSVIANKKTFTIRQYRECLIFKKTDWLNKMLFNLNGVLYYGNIELSDKTLFFYKSYLVETKADLTPEIKPELKNNQISLNEWLIFRVI